MNHILFYAAITHYTPPITNHFISFLILQQPSSTSPQAEQQPHTLLTLYQPHISLHSCIIFCQPIPFQCAFLIYFIPVLLISCLNLILQYPPTHPRYPVLILSSKDMLNISIEFGLSLETKPSYSLAS